MGATERPWDGAVSQGAPCPVEGGNQRLPVSAPVSPDQLEALQTLTQPFR